mgnify:FL=1
MNIFVSGINYKITSIDIREKLKLTKESGEEALRQIIKLPEVLGCVILSTCNRTEIYIHSDNAGFNGKKLKRSFVK